MPMINNNVSVIKQWLDQGGDLSKLLAGYSEGSFKELADLLKDDKTGLEAILKQLDNKVDKRDGMGLSEANFTNDEKEKLSETNILTDDLIDKINTYTFDGYITMPEDSSEIDYDQYTTSGIYKVYSDHGDEQNSSILIVRRYWDGSAEQILTDGEYAFKRVKDENGKWTEWQKIYVSQTDLDKKVDKVDGKGLSTNDFTDELKNKLDGIEPNEDKIELQDNINNKVGKYTQENILDNVELIDGKCLDTSGYLSTNANYITTDYIVIPAGESLSLNGTYRMYAIYDANKTNISSEYKGSEASNFIYTNSTDADKYIRISFRKIYFDGIPIILTRTNSPQLYFAESKVFLESDVHFNNVQNEQLGCYVKKEPFDLLKSIRLFDNCYIHSAGGIISSGDTFYTTDYIKVEKENSLAFTGMFSRFLAYDENLQPIRDTYNSSDRSDFVYTAPADATHYVRVSVRKTTPNNKTMITRTSTVQPYTDVEGVYLEKNVLLNKQQIEQVMGGTLYEYKNMLTGKKWVACGDSFTANGYTAEDGEHTFTKGLYTGKNMVYPFFIGRRCGIDVTNYAAGGMTLAHVDGYNNCFATSKYQTIPADTDYITLYFGINDLHQSVPIGTADDTVNTTFCGAWNVVLEYLITNHPLAHIGIIVSNGTSTAFVEATKQMAVKWGIPYLDLATDKQVPLLLRTNRDDVCTTAKNLRLQTFRVSDTNSHPNNDCHEYESYCIENWLMSL